MADVPVLGKRVFRPSDRFFKFVEYVTIYLDMETYAIVASQNVDARDIFPNANPYQRGPLIPPPGHYRASLQCRQFPIDIKHFIFGPFWATFQPGISTEYEFDFVPTEGPKPKQLTSPKMGSIAVMFWNNLLVFFYEQHARWIRKRYGQHGKDIDKWPELFRFAWALRNAAVHHDGRLNITDEKVPPIKWHHLQYDHSNTGLRVFEEVMTLGDMLLFLIEMSDELDRLGSPHPP